MIIAIKATVAIQNQRSKVPKVFANMPLFVK